jgi:hypothetical protein
MTSIFKILDDKEIQYAVLKGRYDDQSYEYEKIGFKKDLDLVLNCNNTDIIDYLKKENVFKYLEENSFLDIENNLRIDFYFKAINVGYYHFLKIDVDSFLNKKVSEKEYIIYQLLDPLLKFSKYHIRHQYRLERYFTSGIPVGVEACLDRIIGKKFSVQLLKKILDSKYDVKPIFIKLYKFKMLFINGNFVRMIKSRIF